MARKSRKETVITAEPVPSLYVHVALYIRLSVEDNKKRGCSVENQKLVLNDFLADKPGFVVYDTYIDNGMTGTNFHRPGFQQMLSDIEAGYINCVIVKDLSRLGRNSIDTGYYIEQYFYTHNVRFIAVTDQFDTADPGNLHGGIMLPLKNMINEAYSLDIGRKIKAQARQAMKDGDYIGARAPYGYRKDPENCHKLLIDEAAAPVVQQIFQWAYERVALNRIVRNLNEMGIPAPSHYKKTTGEITSPGLIGSGKWQTRTVMKILESEVYTGDLVQGKTKIVDHQQVQAGDDNLIVEHHHTSAINQLRKDNLLRSAADAVHPSHPFHLILSLQLLSDTFSVLHLRDQPIEHLLCCVADFLEMLVQLAGQQHSRVNAVPVLAQIPPARRCKPVFHTAPPFTFTVGGSFFIHILPQNARKRQCVKIRFADLTS